MRLNKNNKQSGQIAMAAVIFFLFVILIILGAYATLAVGHFNTASQILSSKKVFTTAESGIEDAAMRAEHYTGFTLDNTSNPILLNNNTQSVVTVIDEDPDGINETKDYQITSSARGGSIYRKASMFLKIPDGSYVVNVKGALQIGNMGIKTAGGNIIQGNPTGAGKFYSNGSFRSGSVGGDKLEGDLILSRGYGTTVNPTVATLSQTISATINTNQDIAQRFIAPITGNVGMLKLYLGHGAGARVYGNCFNDILITGTTVNLGYEYANASDVRARLDTSMLSWNIPGANSWANLTMTSIKPLISNEVYWIVLDQIPSGTCSALVIGAQPNDDLDQSTNDLLSYNDTTFYKSGGTWGLYGTKYSSIANSYYLIPNYTVLSGKVDPSPNTRDISFALAFGDLYTVADGGPYGVSAVTGNLIAPLIVGFDVWKEAFYDSVNTKPAPGTTALWNVNMTIAGASMGVATKAWDTDASNNCLVNKVNFDSTAAGSYQCHDFNIDNYRCRGMSTGQSASYAPNFGKTKNNFCQCVDGDLSHTAGAPAYCHDLDATPGNPIDPVTYPDKQIPNQTPLFTAEAGPISAELIKENYFSVSGGTTPCYEPSGLCPNPNNWTKEMAQSFPHLYTYRRYAPIDFGDDTTLAPTGSMWLTGQSGTSPNTLRIDGTSNGTGTTTFQLPAYIDGNVDIFSGGSGRIELSSGPPNTSVNAKTQPYVLWIRGDLTMRSTGSNCSITAHQPYTSYVVPPDLVTTVPYGTLNSRGKAGTEIADVYGDPTPKASIKIYVEGLVDIVSPCVARGFWADPRSYVQIISLHPAVGTGGAADFAIRFRGSAKGSALYAPRGGILVDFNGVTQVRSLAANYLELNPGAILQYIEGLPDPYSEFGGYYPIGSEIINMKESE